MSKPDTKPAPLMLARIPNTRHGRAVLAGIREFLNRDRYKLAVEFSGPRHRYAQGGHLSYGTLKENATAFRLYITDEAQRKEGMARWSREYELQQTVQRLESMLATAGKDFNKLGQDWREARDARDEAIERATIAEGHAIDQDIENERLRADLEVIPMWLRRLVAWARMHTERARIAWAKGDA